MACCKPYPCINQYVACANYMRTEALNAACSLRCAMNHEKYINSGKPIKKAQPEKKPSIKKSVEKRKSKSIVKIESVESVEPVESEESEVEEGSEEEDDCSCDCESICDCDCDCECLTSKGTDFECLEKYTTPDYLESCERVMELLESDSRHERDSALIQKDFTEDGDPCMCLCPENPTIMAAELSNKKNVYNVLFACDYDVPACPEKNFNRKPGDRDASPCPKGKSSRPSGSKTNANKGPGNSISAPESSQEKFVKRSSNTAARVKRPPGRAKASTTPRRPSNNPKKISGVSNDDRTDTDIEDSPKQIRKPKNSMPECTSDDCPGDKRGCCSCSAKNVETSGKISSSYLKMLECNLTRNIRDAVAESLRQPFHCITMSMRKICDQTNRTEVCINRLLGSLESRFKADRNGLESAPRQCCNGRNGGGYDGENIPYDSRNPYEDPYGKTCICKCQPRQTDMPAKQYDTRPSQARCYPPRQCCSKSYNQRQSFNPDCDPDLMVLDSMENDGYNYGRASTRPPPQPPRDTNFSSGCCCHCRKANTETYEANGANEQYQNQKAFDNPNDPCEDPNSPEYANCVNEGTEAPVERKSKKEKKRDSKANAPQSATPPAAAPPANAPPANAPPANAPPANGNAANPPAANPNYHECDDDTCTCNEGSRQVYNVPHIVTGNPFLLADQCYRKSQPQQQQIAQIYQDNNKSAYVSETNLNVGRKHQCFSRSQIYSNSAKASQRGSTRSETNVDNHNVCTCRPTRYPNWKVNNSFNQQNGGSSTKTSEKYQQNSNGASVNDNPNFYLQAFEQMKETSAGSDGGRWSVNSYENNQPCCCSQNHKNLKFYRNV